MEETGCSTPQTTKKAKKRRIPAAIWLILAAALLLCAALYAYDTVQRRRAQAELDAVEEYVGPLDAAAQEELERYRNLRRADLSGSEDPAAAAAWAEAHPQVDVTYTVDLGGTVVDNKACEILLEKGAYSLGALREALPLLPALRTVYLQALDCEPQEIADLIAAFPERMIQYSVELSGRLVGDDTEELDLTALTPEELDGALPALRLLPNLSVVELTAPDGSNLLGPDDVQKLQTALPEMLFRYRFTLFGKEISTEDERIEYVKVKIGNEGVDQLRAAQPVLKRCSYLLLDDCGIDDELLAELRDEFPETKIVWRVHISNLSFLTDVKIIHLTFALTNRNAQVMRFCNEVEYLDIGHNTISDISFTRGMPNLKYFILSYNHVSDLSPLSGCKKLEMLELYFCFNLKDISPLTGCESLQLLNVSATAVRDIRPVCELKNLQRFYCIMNHGIPDEQKEQVREALPDCWITFQQDVSKNVGWSFDAKGGVRAQWYLDMYKILRYRVEDWFFGDYPE